MLKTIALVIAAIVVALLLYALTKPDSFAVRRSATIAATPDKLFALVGDVKAFNTWNPWVRDDPSSKLAYEGAATSGVGAAYTWQGGKSGSGRMEIIEATPPSKVAMRLDFQAPMKTTNRVEFTLAPQGASAQATLVTWTMTGPMPYVSKVMTIFFDMDKMVGSQFEAGLANLKAVAEGR